MAPSDENVYIETLYGMCPSSIINSTIFIFILNKHGIKARITPLTSEPIFYIMLYKYESTELISESFFASFAAATMNDYPFTNMFL